MDAREFIRKWRGVTLKEQSAAHEHFLDICALVGHPTPAEADPHGEWYRFERNVEKSGGGLGRADVWMKDHFAWEYKGPHKDLDAAYQQLLRYHESLGQPPLLVVSDYQRYEIHTKWPNTMPRVYKFELEDLTDPTPLHYLRSLFYEPDALHPREFADAMTEEAARRFAALADELRKDTAPRPVAHFLTQVVFCLFAEDIGLLPRGPQGEAGIFTEIVRECQKDKYLQFGRYAEDLFRSMATGGNLLFKEIAHFNGGLFSENGGFKIPALGPEEMARLAFATELDWSAVEPSIFGNLFERGLDPNKRAQLGAHYTSKADIMAIVEPVLMWPLRREWKEMTSPLGLLSTSGEGEKLALRNEFLAKLASVRALDPACGSGNFLYVSLNLLKDLEKEVIQHPTFDGLPPAVPRVSPAQLYGIEISEYAHELASVVVWIGHIQWHRNNGYTYEERPILRKLNNILNMDAILGVTDDGTLYEPEWPEVDVIVGNPPFVGDKKMRGAMGDDYVEAIRGLYGERIPGQSDLVCYWFERARTEITKSRAKRAGLLATQAIRGGANRAVLDAIKQDGDIFFAYSDREWILDGAAVQVSMIGFDNGDESSKFLDGRPVEWINADLTALSNTTEARILTGNLNIAFIGTQKSGPFDISVEVAEQMLRAPINPNGRPNSDVIKPWINGEDITGRSRNMWIIDFNDMPLEQAASYEAPFEFVKKNIKPLRDKSKTGNSIWWLHERPRPAFRNATVELVRYLCTPRVSKHRVFVWIQSEVIPDSATVAFARDDDYFFGVMHSRAHEVWALRQGTQLIDKSIQKRTNEKVPIVFQE